MRIIVSALFLLPSLAFGEVAAVPDSLSPDGQIHAVMDIDRDPKIVPEWKGDSFPQIEITEKATGKVLGSVTYFGAMGDDARPLREHVQLSWRPDSQAFGITIIDRFYSSCEVFVLDEKRQVASVSLPSDYEQMTGFPRPETKHLRPRGRNTIVGWDQTGNLIYDIFLVPLATFTGKDPLKHRFFLKVSGAQMTIVKVEHEEGHWQGGSWIATVKEQSEESK